MPQIPSDLLLFIPWPTLEFQCERKDAGNGDLIIMVPMATSLTQAWAVVFIILKMKTQNLKLISLKSICCGNEPETLLLKMYFSLYSFLMISL